MKSGQKVAKFISRGQTRKKEAKFELFGLQEANLAQPWGTVLSVSTWISYLSTNMYHLKCLDKGLLKNREIYDLDL